MHQVKPTTRQHVLELEVPFEASLGIGDVRGHLNVDHIDGRVPDIVNDLRCARFGIPELEAARRLRRGTVGVVFTIVVLEDRRCPRRGCPDQFQVANVVEHVHGEEVRLLPPGSIGLAVELPVLVVRSVLELGRYVRHNPSKIQWLRSMHPLVMTEISSSFMWSYRKCR